MFDRIEINDTIRSFVTLKDRQENIVNHPKTRIVNPAENETARF